MKKLLIGFIVTTLFFVQGKAQDDIVKPDVAPTSVGIVMGLHDFYSAQKLRNIGLTNSIQSKRFFRFTDMDFNLGAMVTTGLTPGIDFAGTITASFLKYPSLDGRIKNEDDRRRLLLEAVAQANIKLLKNLNVGVNPYISVGVGASTYNGYYAAILPVGIGMQFKAGDDGQIHLFSQYRIPVTQNAAYHFTHSLGYVHVLNKKEVIYLPPPPPPAPVDTDGDGIPDADDKCPNQAGLAMFNGCPDSDGDGIPDPDDKCPNKAGVAKYQGCPIPDSDGDGINDEQDKCPNQAGVARYQGCPIPDSDGDGINDEEDKCPTRAGTAANYGCPEIPKATIDKVNLAAKSIYFQTNSATLSAKSYTPLRQVAKILTDDPELRLSIDGYTDSQGSDEYNLQLSDKRANAVLQYLLSLKIDQSRLKAKGHGEADPVADNNTAAGRAKNRRTEMTLSNYEE